jgi:hypothetical protein
VVLHDGGAYDLMIVDEMSEDDDDANLLKNNDASRIIKKKMYCMK